MQLNHTRNHLAKVEAQKEEVFQIQQHRISSFQCNNKNHQEHHYYLKNMRNKHKENKFISKQDWDRCYNSNNNFMDINRNTTMSVKRSKNNLINNSSFNSRLLRISKL